MHNNLNDNKLPPRVQSLLLPVVIFLTGACFAVLWGVVEKASDKLRTPKRRMF